MFDIAPSELLLVAVVALLVIGPKDLPLALRAAGKWLGKARRMSNHFRAGVETMIREAELAEIEKEWRERNARIMAEHPDAETLDKSVVRPPDGPEMLPLDSVTAEARLARPVAHTEPEPEPTPDPAPQPQPELPPAPDDQKRDS